MMEDQDLTVSLSASIIQGSNIYIDIVTYDESPYIAVIMLQ